MSKDAVVVMAKAPETHRVKTRLIPPLEPKIASHLYYCFLLDKLKQVRNLEGICPMIAYTPLNREDFFKNFQGYSLIPQIGSDLGEKLANVTKSVFEQGYEKMVILDSDSPNLPSKYIYDGLRCLEAVDVVIGPCLDGGYYLIGLTRYMPELFHDIPWSTGMVVESTMEKARRSTLTVSIINEWYDVDTVEDLVRLKKDLEKPCKESYLCENTYRMVSGMEL